MEYIECTHCGKRYAVNEQASKSEGDFVRCKSCSGKFMVIVHNSEFSDEPNEEDIHATSEWDPTKTSAPQPRETSLEIEDDHEPSEESVIDWDPSLTMPDEQEDEEGFENEVALSDEEVQAKATEALLKIRQEKKKKMVTYILLAVVTLLLSLTLYMLFEREELETLPTASTVKRLSIQEQDAQSLDCRMAAAEQWLLDYKAMHENYSAQDFIAMLGQSQSSEEELKSACKSLILSKSILDAATDGEKPEWFAAEIEELIYQ